MSHVKYRLLHYSFVHQCIIMRSAKINVFFPQENTEKYYVRYIYLLNKIIIYIYLFKK